MHTVKMSTESPGNATPGAASGTVRVTLGERIVVRRGPGAPIELAGKSAALVALVGVETAIDRRRVAGMLWPDSSEDQVRNNLRTLVHRLNVRVGSNLLSGVEQLSLGARVLSEVVPDSADAVLRALAAKGLRGCELLSGLRDEKVSGPLVSWLDATRQRLRQRQLQQLREALAQAEAAGEGDRATALARACVHIEPFNERNHRQLMTTLAHFGDRAAALAAYESVKSLLRDQLGVSPDLQTRAVQLRILQDEAVQGQRARGEGGRAPARPTVKPVATTGLHPLDASTRYALVERDAVRAEVRAAIVAGRHVTLEGEAGVGKTRLLRSLTENLDGALHVALYAAAREGPYAALAHVLHTVQPRVQARVAVAAQLELARLAPLPFSGVQMAEGPLSASRLNDALGEWLHALGQAGVRFLVIDDLHYADASSQAAFAALVDSREEARADAPRLLLAFRSGEIGSRLSEVLVNAKVGGRTAGVTLQRLSLSGVRLLLQDVGIDPGRAAQYLQRTGGNPLFLIELAQHSLESGVDPDEASPSGLDTLLRWRLSGCSEPARQLACAAAVASQEFTVELAASVLDKSPLALMPAWNQLQQRGLFADHGLAHDLVREAALRELPAPDAVVLHARVAAYLESQGLCGIRVLRHWLAAGAPDCALPHAVRQLHAAVAAGLETHQLEVELIDLLLRVTDPVLLDNLWVTAQTGLHTGGVIASEAFWRRLKLLLERVKELPVTKETTVWIAFESARQSHNVDRRPRAAYELLIGTLDLLPEDGLQRACVEHELLQYGREFGGNHQAQQHARNAQRALSKLPKDPSLRRLRAAVGNYASLVSGPVEVVRERARQLRAARGWDRAAAMEASMQLAVTHQLDGNLLRAYRHYRRAASFQATTSVEELPMGNPNVAAAAMAAGRYDLALRCIETCHDSNFDLERPAFLAAVYWRLGNIARARLHAAEVRWNSLKARPGAQVLATIIRAEMDEHEGLDPLPALRSAYGRLAAAGMTGITMARLDWQLTRREKPPADRWVEGQALIELIAGKDAGHCSIMVDAAEAAACAGIEQAQWEPFVRQAARMSRRGKGEITRYHVLLLVRCARLLQASDPREAESLWIVARRRVLQALPHVPPEADESFRALPINAMLLAHASLPGRQVDAT